jgi:hypothetical protein
VNNPSHFWTYSGATANNVYEWWMDGTCVLNMATNLNCQGIVYFTDDYGNVLYSALAGGNNFTVSGTCSFGVAVGSSFGGTAYQADFYANQIN